MLSDLRCLKLSVPSQKLSIYGVDAILRPFLSRQGHSEQREEDKKKKKNATQSRNSRLLKFFGGKTRRPRRCLYIIGRTATEEIFNSGNWKFWKQNKARRLQWRLAAQLRPPCADRTAKVPQGKRRKPRPQECTHMTARRPSCGLAEVPTSVWHPVLTTSVSKFTRRLLLAWLTKL